MSTTHHLAKHIRDVHFGGNWTCTNLKDTLADVNWQQATTKISSFNTIATLTFHVSYFVEAVLKVLNGEMLDANDKFSFDHPPINSQEDWENFQNKIWMNAKNFADLVEHLPEEKLWEDFSNQKYGNYYRNIQGIIEHTHYHLGQISLIKKML